VRVAGILLVLVLAQAAWGTPVVAATPAAKEGSLILIPTMVQELDEYRVNTKKKAVLGDGTMNAVYVMRRPAMGNTYLNFHLEIASDTSPIVLRCEEIRLEGTPRRVTTDPVAGSKKRTASDGVAAATYLPWDCFVDTGSAEERAEPMLLQKKAIVQFTIEVPSVGLDDLTLFVRSQRIGTVGEIRERIAKRGS
jgi:hypothetical protein